MRSSTSASAMTELARRLLRTPQGAVGAAIVQVSVELLASDLQV